MSYKDTLLKRTLESLERVEQMDNKVLEEIKALEQEPTKEYVNLLTDEELKIKSDITGKVNYIVGVLDMCCDNKEVRDVCKEYLREIGQLAVRTKP